MSDSLESALALYETAFKQDSSRITGKDLYNAMMAAAQMLSYDNGARYLSELMRRDFDIGQLDSMEVMQGFLGSDAYKEYVRHDLHRDDMICQSRVDRSFYERVELLRRADQNKYCKGVGIQHEITDSVTHQLMNLLNEYGGYFPREMDIGVSKDKYEQLSTSPLYDVLVIHSFQAGENELIPFLQKSLRKGTLSPELYSFYMGFYNPDYSDHCYVSSTNCNWYKKDLSEKNVETINNNRRSIGLYTLNELVERALYYHGQSKRPSFKMFVPVCKFKNEEMKLIYTPLNLVDQKCG